MIVYVEYNYIICISVHNTLKKNRAIVQRNQMYLSVYCQILLLHFEVIVVILFVLLLDDFTVLPFVIGRLRW